MPWDFEGHLSQPMLGAVKDVGRIVLEVWVGLVHYFELKSSKVFPVFSTALLDGTVASFSFSNLIKLTCFYLKIFVF